MTIFDIRLESDDGTRWNAHCGEDWAQAPSPSVAVSVLLCAIATRCFGKRDKESKATLKALGFAPPRKPKTKKAKRR